MPRVSWDSAAAWSAYYQRLLPDGRTLGYGREFYDSALTPDYWPEAVLPLDQRHSGLLLYDHRWWRLTQVLGITPSDRVLVGGCGFGYLMAAARAAGYPLTWGLDSSTWIDGNGPTEAIDSTLWVRGDFRGGGAVRNALRQLTGDDQFDWVITESVLESYVPAPPPEQGAPGPQDPAKEMWDILQACELSLLSSDLSRCVHLVHQGPRLSSAFTVLTIDEWQSVRPAHTWIGVTFSTAWEVRQPA